MAAFLRASHRLFGMKASDVKYGYIERLTSYPEILKKTFYAHEKELLDADNGLEKVKAGREMTAGDLSLWDLVTPPQYRSLIRDEIKEQNIHVKRDDFSKRFYSLSIVVYEEDGWFGFGCVLRDDKGRVKDDICSRVRKEAGISSAGDAMLHAIIQGVEMAKKHSTKLYMYLTEIDDLDIARTINTGVLPEANLEIFLDALAKLYSLESWKIENILREGDQVASYLAEEGAKQSKNPIDERLLMDRKKEELNELNRTGRPRFKYLDE